MEAAETAARKRELAQVHKRGLKRRDAQKRGDHRADRTFGVRIEVRDDGDAAEAEGEPEAPSAQTPAQVVELSGYYLDDLVDAANAIGLIPYRQVESEAPFQYYNESLILAGNQRVENIVIYGAGYEVFGVGVGTDANTARAFLNAAGLDYAASANGITFEHKATESSLFRDANGHDSCINLWLDENDVVTEIDWSSYTG